FVGDLHSGIRIEGGVNPHLEIIPKHLTLKGTGIPGDLIKKHVTEIKNSTANLSWTSKPPKPAGASVVGIEMLANPLGPDHPLGSEASGQEDLFDQLPTDPKLPVADRFIKGHLLNYDL